LGSQSYSYHAKLGCYLDRYSINTGPPMHISKTSIVHLAYDMETECKVALKFMQTKEHLVREITARQFVTESEAIGIRCWHTPAGITLDVQHEQQSADKTDDMHPEYPFLLVMEAAGRSLHAACSQERIAGYDPLAVVEIVRSIAHCIHTLHTHGVCHGDIKPRNVLRCDSGAWVLCDFDVSAKVGERIEPGMKRGSSSYASVELAKGIFFNATAITALSFDMWSLGVVLYELCTGQTLFKQDIANDDLVQFYDQIRLCAWNTISDEDLGPVFARIQLEPQVTSSARNLIRWCLKGCATERPTITEFLEHDFLCCNQKLCHLPMRYTFFISHAQADAAGTAKMVLSTRNS